MKLFSFYMLARYECGRGFSRDEAVQRVKLPRNRLEGRGARMREVAMIRGRQKTTRDHPCLCMFWWFGYSKAPRKDSFNNFYQSGV